MQKKMAAACSNERTEKYSKMNHSEDFTIDIERSLKNKIKEESVVANKIQGVLKNIENHKFEGDTIPASMEASTLLESERKMPTQN